MAFTRLFCLAQFLSFVFFTSAAPSSFGSAIEARAVKANVHFTINLTWEDHAPVGGAPRKTILTNGTMPGPPLRMKVGDTVEFMVYNNLPNETAVHFHGITQLNTPWSDGVPGLSQKPIAPGKSFLYKWTADEYGTYFYHAHARGQIMDGMYGAIIIAPKDTEARPFKYISNNTADLSAMRAAESATKPVFLSDWSQYTSSEFLGIQTAANIDNYCMDAIIINGQGSQYCLSRDEITAYTNPALTPLLAAVQPPQLTDKGCLPPNVPAVQGNYSFNVASIPANAFSTCTQTSGPMALFPVDSKNKWASLTLINSGAIDALQVSIDNHKMYVYAVDGRYIVPQAVDSVTVGNGDRYAVMIKLDQQVGQYAIRVANSGLNQVISGFAVLSYAGSTGPSTTAYAKINYAGLNTTSDFVAFVDRKIVPFPNLPPRATSDKTFLFNITKLGPSAHAYTWSLSGVEAYNLTAENNSPYLFQKPASIPTSDLVLSTKKGQWVDLIVKVAGPLAQPHPMHKHSNKAYVIGGGVGPFPYATVADAQKAGVPFNFVNPPLRDGFTTTPAEGNSSWMALRYQVINPGPFLFHCHSQTHFSGGMAVALLDGVDAWPSVPSEYLNGGNGVVKSTKKTKTP